MVPVTKCNRENVIWDERIVPPCSSQVGKLSRARPGDPGMAALKPRASHMPPCDLPAPAPLLAHGFLPPSLFPLCNTRSTDQSPVQQDNLLAGPTHSRECLDLIKLRYPRSHPCSRHVPVITAGAGWRLVWSGHWLTARGGQGQAELELDGAPPALPSDLGVRWGSESHCPDGGNEAPSRDFSQLCSPSKHPAHSHLF